MKEKGFIMNLVADLHTHTIASTHAYATITEMVKAASEKNLLAIAITDHSRLMPGAPGAFYFESLSIVPESLFGVRVLKGIEANICSYDGEIDVDDDLQNNLEWIVASLHSITIKGEPTVEKCTNAYLKIAQNPNVNVIAHSGSSYFKYDYEKVIPVLAKNGKLIEINDSTFRNKKESMANCIEIAKLCKKHKARIAVNPDAHFWTQVGNAENTLRMLKDIDFPEKLIVNSSKENLLRYFKENNISII